MERETQESSLVEISHPDSEDIVAFLDTPGIDDDRPANEVFISVNTWLKRSAYLLTAYIVTEKQVEIATTMFPLADF